MLFLRRLGLAALILSITLFAVPARAFLFFGSNDDAVETPEPSPIMESTNIPEPSPTPAPTPLPEIKDVDNGRDSTLRVWLSSLKDPKTLGITLTGSYALENNAGFRFKDETQIEIIASGKNLFINCAGMIVNMGTSFTLTRHSESGGIVIHETERQNTYNGNMKFVSDKGVIRAILSIDIEEYLYGVVPYEMSDSFPIEALKAQAVAARTYACSRKNASRDYDVVDTTNDQVFRGFDSRTLNTVEAVNSTKGVVGLYKDKYATCFFTASNGGQTAMPDQIWKNAGDYGWLDVRDDPYDIENPSSPVKTLDISVDPLENTDRLMSEIITLLTEQMSALGYSDEAKDIKVISINSAEPAEPMYQGGNRMYTKLRLGLTVSGKVLYEPDPTPDANTQPVNREETVDHALYVDLDFYTLLKDKFGLKISSIDCEIMSVTEIKNDEGKINGFRVESRRFGHGVGMSQRGAQQMASAHGFGYREILAFYYPGMTLVREKFVKEPIVALEALPVGLGYSRPRPTPSPTPAPLPEIKEGETYATAKLDSNASSLNIRDSASTSGKILGTLSNGQRLIVIETYADIGWAKIKTAEAEGYASLQYISIQ